jgi:UDP-N-acetylglucosamine--N-acetylmuramyl-(pentapeptide) pyrophosphoryl-undecaprenol N-acetylglucosamine transferase
VRAVLLGGGTAGHLFPSVAVAQRLLEHEDTQVLFIGAEGRLDAQILTQQGFPHELIPAHPFPYGLSAQALRAGWALLRGFRRCRRVLRRFRPGVVFGSGGYVSAAGILAAASLGIPRVCHASDALPDRANRLLAPWATRITTHYQAAAARFPPGRVTVTGQPVRREFLTASREEARQALGIPPEAFVFLVAGGSQGARSLNYATLGALPTLLEDPDTHVVHLTGARDYEDVMIAARDAVGENPRYQAHAFHAEPWVTAAAADLGLTRGGASSLAEWGVCGLPMIVAPYPYAAAHQQANAAPLVEAGAAVLVPDAELTADWLTARVLTLRGDTAALDRMAEAARQASHPTAAEDIAAIVAALGGGA